MPPTRLDRARFKLLDLISARTGARTALIAYAGSAHVVMPPTVDAAVIKPFLESLDPAIMPSGGASAATVLPLARRLLGDQAAISTVLFVTDGFQPGDAEALAAFATQPQAPALAALIMATQTGGLALMPDGTPVLDSRGARLDTRLNESLLSRVAAAANMSVVHADPAGGDVRRLLRLIQSNLHRADDPDARWRDQAWWFLWPAALAVLLWFRRGWTMQW